MSTQDQSRTAVVIRRAREDERDDAARLAVAAFAQFRDILSPPDWPEMAESIRATTALEQGGELLVALVNERLAGSVVYCAPGAARHELFPADWAFMRALAVPPSARGLGIGRRLAGACLIRARKDGAKVFGLHTADEMTSARGLYGHLGFRAVDDAPAYFGLRYRIYRLDLG